jgi:hypothetical protein
VTVAALHPNTFSAFCSAQRWSSVTGISRLEPRRITFTSELEESAIGQALLRDDELTASWVEVADLLRLTPDGDPAAFRQRLTAYRADAELAARGALDINRAA